MIVNTSTPSKLLICLTPSLLVRCVIPEIKKSDVWITSPPSNVAGGLAFVIVKYDFRIDSIDSVSFCLLSGLGLVMNAFPVINDSGENFAFLKKVLGLQIICPEIRLFQFFLYFLKFFLFAVQFKDNPGG